MASFLSKKFASMRTGKQLSRTSSSRSMESAPEPEPERVEKGQTVIGIDLGNNYCRVAVCKDGNIIVIPDKEGNKAIPSFVSFTNLERLIGEEAVKHATVDPVNTIYDFKRMIGRKIHDQSVQRDKELWPFEIVSYMDVKLGIEVYLRDEKIQFCTEEIVSMLLSQMKEIAEDFLKSPTPITNAVVTVPTYFNHSQRMAIMDAGTIAGFDFIHLINESSAAALAHVYDKMSTAGKRYAVVFHSGGATTDVSVLRINKGVAEVLSTAGDTHLGGEDFTQKIVCHCLNEFLRINGKDKKLILEPKSMARLRAEAEKAKVLLSSEESASFGIQSLHDGIDYTTTIQRYTFEELSNCLFTRCVELMETCLLDVPDKDFGIGSVNDIVLAGGCTKIPKLQEDMLCIFKDKYISKSNRDESVVTGAAVQAAILSGVQTSYLEDIHLREINSTTVGVGAGGVSFSTVMHRLITELPTSLHYMATPIIEEGHKDIYSIPVYQGETVTAQRNVLLGYVRISDLPKDVKINLLFKMDNNGIVGVYPVKSKKSKEKTRSVMFEDTRLTEAEKGRMVLRATKLKNDDVAAAKKRVEEAEEAGNKVVEDIKQDIRAYIQDLEEKMKNNQKMAADDGMTVIEEAIAETNQWLEDNKNTNANASQYSAEYLKLIRKCDEVLMSLVFAKPNDEDQ